MTKAQTLRVPDDLAVQIKTIALVDGSSQAEIMRSALAAYVEERFSDPGFRADAIAHAQAVLARIRDAV